VSVTHPVYDFIPLQLSGNRASKAMYAPGGWLSPAKLAFLDAKVREVCDALDGAVDGLVSNPAACAHAFDVRAYRCAGGDDTGDRCYSDAQLATLDTLNSRTSFGFALQSGVDGFARWPIFEGAALAGLFGGGTSAVPHKPARAFEDFGLYALSDPAMRYFVAQDAATDSLALDPTAYRERLQTLSEQIDASRVSLEPFEAHGGKMLLMHGTSDFAVPVHNTTDYYLRLLQHFGAQRLDGFVRYYVVPGFAHGGGPFDMTWDPLATLDAWVDRGRPPADLVTTDRNPANHARTRPMCRYPSWPQFVGPDVDAASSFVCRR
jgi:feruloyl esterase